MLCSEVVWLVVNVGDEWTQLHMFRRWYEEMDYKVKFCTFFTTRCFCNFLSPVAQDSFLDLCHG